MERITARHVRSALDHLVRAASAAGYPLPEALELDVGQPTYGIAWRLHHVVERGGHAEIHQLGLSGGYLGSTAREAHDCLHAMARVYWGIAQIHADRARAAV